MEWTERLQLLGTPLILCTFIVDLVHEVKTNLMLETVHAGFLFHIASFSHPLSEDIGLTQHIMISILVYRSIVILILGVSSHLRVN